MSRAQRLVTITDFVFTAVGVILIVVTGRMMSASLGGITASTWLSIGWGLFIASGVIWVCVLLPLQIKQAKLAKNFVAENEIPEQYWLLSRYWTIFWPYRYDIAAGKSVFYGVQTIMRSRR